MRKAISGEEKYFDNTGLGYSIGFSNALLVANHHDNPWHCQGERSVG